MHTDTITIQGKRYVVIPEKEYESLVENKPPVLPKPDRNGCRPAVESVRVIMAQQLIADRQKAGMSQAELAKRAGIRQETISRIESGKVTPTIKTMEAIDKALSN
ncbi:MAG TPA: XRE family transcriptional regulator [Phycisphaerales bacterium]|nr:XRE family transcriptional regulator [Phycisphaerales bacterium]|tara:strand:- start:370 stop:684 length:315 start_codon:yes stop_codon:yes gene_type:complete